MQTEITERHSDSGALYYIRIGGVLLMIAAVVAVMLALVNMITVDKIAENKRNEMQSAIAGIFTTSDEVNELEGLNNDMVSAVYEVKGGGELLGHCAYVLSSGFGGNIEMMVGINTDGTLAGVKIVALSETPGLGSRVNDSEYLSQYSGKSGTLSFGDEVDAISGATISSRAVLAGVNAALALEVGGEG